MATIEELQQQHEARLDSLVAETAGRGTDSDWALCRALMHKAVHLLAERKAGEFCTVATYMAELIGHAHQLLHGEDKRAASHHDVLH